MLQPVTTQLYTLDGQPQEEAAPGLYAQRAPSGSPNSRGDTLFLHVSLTGSLDVTGDLLQTLVQAFVSHFFAQSGSLTAALRQSVDVVNERLREVNKSAEIKRQGALTAAVLRDDMLLMTQVGEVQAFLGHSFGLEPIPLEETGDIIPLGISTTLNPRFFHNRLQDGNLLLLADPRVAHWPKERFVDALVDTDMREAHAKLAQMLTRTTARLLLVGFHEGEAQLLEWHDEPFQPLFEDGATMQEKADQLEATRVREQRRARLRPTTPAVMPPAEIAAEDEEELPFEEPKSNIRANPASAPLAEVMRVRERSESAAPALKGAQRRGRKAAATGLRGASNGLRGLASFLDKLRAPQDEDAPPRENLYATLLVIFIPIIVAVVLISGLSQSNQRAQISVLREQIGSVMAEATEIEESDPNRARELYRQVLALSDEAQSIVPNDSVENQRNLARERLDRLDGVLRLSAETLYTYPEGTQLTAIALGMDDLGQRYIYTLDGANSIVYQHRADADYTPTEETPLVVMRQGEGVGTELIGTLSDLVWKPANAQTDDTISAIDAAGTAFSYYPTSQQKVAVSLPLSTQWRNPVSLITYLGRLYILDQGDGAGEMWRYLPNGDDFIISSDSRSLILPDMAQAIDSAISVEDTSVVMLYEDGRLRRYRDGRLLWDENTIVEQGLTSPLIAPVSVKIAGIGVQSSIYVLDPATERVVEFSFGGTPLTQIRLSLAGGQSEVLGSATDIATAGTPTQLFVVGENRLMRAER